MLLSKDRLYVHIPVCRLIEFLDKHLPLMLNAEIYLDSEFIDNHSNKHIDLIKSYFEKSGLSKRTHGPFIDLNPGSSDRQIRQKTAERFMAALQLCGKLQSESMVLHTHFEPIFYRNHFDEWLKNSCQVWDRLLDEALKKKISIFIENSIETDTRAVSAILKKYPYFGACFDVAHHNVFNPKGWKAAMEEYPLGSIKEVHLSDNNGDEDSHMPLGDGSIQFEELFNEIARRKENPIFTIEPHSQDGLDKSLGFIKRFMNEDR